MGYWKEVNGMEKGKGNSKYLKEEAGRKRLRLLLRSVPYSHRKVGGKINTPPRFVYRKVVCSYLHHMYGVRYDYYLLLLC